MNLINPQLLLSAQVASLVLLASLFASIIVWLCCRRHPSPPQKTKAAPLTAREAAGSLGEDLRRHLASTESQCVEALEQRDEADRQAVLLAGELRKIQEELAQLKARATVPLEDHTRSLQKLAQAEALASLRQGQLEQLAKDKTEAEIALQAQIDKLKEAPHARE